MVKLGGKRAKLTSVKLYIHEILDESKKRHFDACLDLIAEHPEVMETKSLNEARKQQDRVTTMLLQKFSKCI